MPAVVLIGAQWGDEGKGKITDFLAEKSQVVVRYQGGSNAGHTIVLGPEVYKLHLVPSGIFYPEKLCLIAGGVVLDPAVLLAELASLRLRGVSAANLRVSTNAHVIMPYHRLLDELEENARGAARIGTTGRGIGPAYRDKINRSGIRVQDLLEPDLLSAKLDENLAEKNALLTKIYGHDPLPAEAIRREYLEYGARLAPSVTDTALLVNERLARGERVLFEGAQGIMLDLDHGTYPFVTSSNPVAGGACTGAGVGPLCIDSVVGVLKAYTTRVGSGPFPTELAGEKGDLLRQRGGEYGTTTGRARRCGWLDAVVARYAVRISGLSHLALMKLDVLTGFGPLKICTGYRLPDGTILTEFPQSARVLSQITPVYEELAGWDEDVSGIRDFDRLPATARAYVRRVEELAGAPVTLLAVGPEREQTIARGHVFAPEPGGQ
ncbi:MAG: adenylosuccinate synthase [Gracilibacteraceae bacterium]|nr:adenylosuccinate synthase [Gracilibacteraceae bacterium]